MFDASAALARLTDALDALAALDLARLDNDQLLELLRGVERQRRRLPTFDHAMIAELDRRGSAAEFAARDTRTLLRYALRLSPVEAKARYEAAVDLGPRYTVTSEPLGPIFSTVAAAQAEGAISTDHARVIRRAVDALRRSRSKTPPPWRNGWWPKRAASTRPCLPFCPDASSPTCIRMGFWPKTSSTSGAGTPP